MKFVIEFDTYSPEEPNYVSAEFDIDADLETVANSVREDFANGKDGAIYQFQTALDVWQIIRLEGVRSIRVRAVEGG